MNIYGYRMNRIKIIGEGYHNKKIICHAPTFNGNINIPKFYFFSDFRPQLTPELKEFLSIRAIRRGYEIIRFPMLNISYKIDEEYGKDSFAYYHEFNLNEKKKLLVARSEIDYTCNIGDKKPTWIPLIKYKNKDIY